MKIELQKLTPQVYYDKSRDFQFIGRLFDIVLNSVKTNSDTLYNLPNGKNKDERLLNLLALTLGFQSRHNYNSKQLEAICSVLPLIIKNKGSLRAIVIATNAILHAEGLTQPLDYSIKASSSITLYLPTQLSDITLLSDLMTYILPAGMFCEFVKEIQSTTNVESTVLIKHKVEHDVITDNALTKYNRLISPAELKQQNTKLVDDQETADIIEGRGILMNMQLDQKPSGGE